VLQAPGLSAFFLPRAEAGRQLQAPGAERAAARPRRFEAFERLYPFLCTISTRNNAVKR